MLGQQKNGGKKLVVFAPHFGLAGLADCHPFQGEVTS